MADALPHERARRVLRQHLGGDRVGGGVHETAGLLVGGDQGLDFRQQGRVIAARLREKGGALFGRALQCGVEQLFNSLVAFRSHEVF